MDNFTFTFTVNLVKRQCSKAPAFYEASKIFTNFRKE
jgi:hypothetical protein